MGMEGKKWKRFFFESNMFFDHIEDMDGWRRLRAAYPRHTDEMLLAAQEATYGGTLPREHRDAHPNYGFRGEHDGLRTLGDFFKANGMEIEGVPAESGGCDGAGKFKELRERGSKLNELLKDPPARAVHVVRALQ
jgi:hypothetical protein